ncbi:hypothetical protein SALBM217S_06285 [Streptomyces griseoloalbus]
MTLRVLATYRATMDACGLTVPASAMRRATARMVGRQAAPVPPCRSLPLPTGFGLVMRLRMAAGQAPEDFNASADRLRHAWGAHAVHVRPTKPGRLELRLVGWDVLADVRPPRRRLRTAAPIYKSDSLHSAVVEIIVKKNARCRYTTIQNWSNNVYNLVTKRAVAYEGATMEWIDGNIGSKVTMKYPAVYLMGEHAKGETLSIAFAGEGQHQDAGAKMVHMAPNTSSNIVSKSVARGGGRTSYRGLIEIGEGAPGSKSNVLCDALLVDTISRSDTYPYVDVREDDVSMGHEATVSKVSEDQLFYLMSRGLSEDEAMAMIVRGFVEPIAKELPMEYALELNRLIELQMEGAVG